MFSTKNWHILINDFQNHSVSLRCRLFVYLFFSLCFPKKKNKLHTQNVLKLFDLSSCCCFRHSTMCKQFIDRYNAKELSQFRFLDLLNYAERQILFFIPFGVNLKTNRLLWRDLSVKIKITNFTCCFIYIKMNRWSANASSKREYFDKIKMKVKSTSKLETKIYNWYSSMQFRLKWDNWDAKKMDLPKKCKNSNHLFLSRKKCKKNWIILLKSKQFRSRADRGFESSDEFTYYQNDLARRWHLSSKSHLKIKRQRSSTLWCLS